MRRWSATDAGLAWSGESRVVRLLILFVLAGGPSIGRGSSDPCSVGPTLLSSQTDNFSGWTLYGNISAAPTRTLNYGTAPDGTANATTRVQYAAVSASLSESSMYYSIPSNTCAGVVCTYSLFLKSVNGASGNLPVATAEGGRDGQNPQNCAFTSEWSRCVLTVNNTGTVSAVWTGYVEEYSGTGPAMDLELWRPKVEPGGGGASPTSCPPELQGAYRLVGPGYRQSRLTSSWGIVARDGAGLVTTSDGTMVLLGGWNGTAQPTWGDTVTTNEVYRSADGVTWTSVLAHAAAPPQTGAGQRWRRRHAHGTLLVTISGTEYIYIIGGDGFDSFFGGDGAGGAPYPTDVWRSAASTYGATWERMTASAEWGSRLLHMVWALGETLYVAGGQTCQTTGCVLNDVWKSTDAGATWSRVTHNAPWTGRGTFSNSLPVLNGKAYLIGGEQYDNSAADRVYYNDVWSFDGTTWEQHTPAAPWTARGYHNVLLWNSRLWLLRGAAASGMLNDAWWSVNGRDWTQSRGAAGRTDHAGSAAITSAGTLLICGGTGNGAGGCWSLGN